MASMTCTCGNPVRVQPTTIGLIPPSFFYRTMREAPKNNGNAEEAVLPSRTILMMAVRDLSRWEALPLAELQAISLT